MLYRANDMELELAHASTTANPLRDCVVVLYHICPPIESDGSDDTDFIFFPTSAL